MPSGARGFLVLADGEPEIADAAAEEEVAEHEDQRRQREDHIVEHRRRAAQHATGRCAYSCLTGRNRPLERIDQAPIVEADAGELGEGDGQDGEINAGNAEAEGEIADDRAAGGGERDGGEQAQPRADAEMRVNSIAAT